jgi:hypothetical protein
VLGFAPLATLTLADDIVERFLSAAITEAGDTLSSSVEIPIDATAALTEADDTASSATTVEITATLAVTEDDDISASAVVIEFRGFIRARGGSANQIAGHASGTSRITGLASGGKRINA